MKRQGENTSGQPPIKKPSDKSSDLRSKISAKLQTLLSGIDAESVLSAKRRKQLYEDLFGKPKYSEIIIDPTIVIKEEPDDEECSNDSTLLSSQKLLLSAKSRLTELLNKQDGANKYKESGKENNLYCNRDKSSGKLNSLQNPSCSKLPSHSSNFLNKKRNSTNKEYSVSSSGGEIHLKKLVVVLEDCMNSNLRMKLPPTKHPVSNINSSVIETNYVSKQDGHTTSLNNKVNKKPNNNTDLCSDRKAKSCTYSETSTSECSFIENLAENSRSKSFKNPGSVFSNPSSPSRMEHTDTFSSTKDCKTQFPYDSEDEMIDDPIIPQVIVDIKVGEPILDHGSFNFEAENSDSDIELLCEKEPTHEVITLEDNGNEDEIEDDQASEHKKGNHNAAKAVEFVHECKQCGKSFRAESLLNFHIRMHGNSVAQSLSSSSPSFS